MNTRPNIVILTLFALFLSFQSVLAQDKQSRGGYLVPVCIYEGDTIPCVQLPTVYIFKPLKFKNDKERMEYYRLVRNVKKVYPIAREINRTILETYEYLQTLPNEKARQKHIKRVEKGLKDQYTLTCDTMIIPFCMESPNIAINPTAEDTFSVIPRTLRASIPPKSARGTIANTSPACRNFPNVT